MSILRNIAVLLVLAVLVAGCSGKEARLQDGDSGLTEEVHQVISDHIVQKYSSVYGGTEKQFEVHRVYGSSEESDGILSVYMWSYYGGFNRSSGTKNQSGHSLPAVVKLKEAGGEYSVVKYTEPEDGSGYLPSLKKMFPEKYLKSAQQGAGNIGDLQVEMDRKVNQWLAG
ncbi:hypothetical protein [Paenibacillus koleovorans]|uniref:hypothetical protein n=1 Tax=Paenibacillus koleovorans TaxID=121608 RepID=UPI000FD7CB6F|nr:hypothetical protein [Paenibacillus koleovorans]